MLISAEVVPARSLNYLYIWLDIAFLVLFTALLVWRKKYLTVLFALAGGVLYFIVDYGIFYLALGTREVDGANPAAFLLWLSMSYGMTNFAWICLFLARDKRLLEWSVLIIAWWIACPLLAQNFGAPLGEIAIRRGTDSYHGVMALILFVGYALVIVMNLRNPPDKRIPVAWLLFTGIFVQFAWEFCLLITGIRPTGLMPLIVDSLVETNLGLPYLYFIYKALSRRFGEDLSRRRKPPRPADSRPEAE